YLNLGQAMNVDIKLTEDSQQLETIVLSARKNQTFNSDRTGAETSIGKRELTVLPTISRSAADFYRLEPSASGGSFGGKNDQFNNFSLDGSIFNNPFGLDAATAGGQTGTQPISLDAIEQIQVSIAPYDVTQSGFTGASVNAVTKSGTNEFKGSVFGFFRNQDLTGSKIAGEELFKADLEQVQYGVSIGGPIVENKLFFFANFEKEKRTDLGSSWIANNGDGTTGINESRVLESDLISVSDALATLGYQTGAYQGFTHETASQKGIFKLDWNIDDNNRLAFIYNFLDASRELPAHPTAIKRRGPDANTLQFQNSGYKINNKISSFLVELNSRFGNNISNKFQAGFTQFDDSRDPMSAPAPVITITKDGTPYIIAGHEPFSINNVLDQKVFQITNNLNITKGAHNFTVGFSFEKFMFKNSFNLKGYGFDIFGQVDINDFDAADYAQAFADAKTTYNDKNALGSGVDNGWNLSELNVGQVAVYAQDEWNISDNFKTTFGLRIDKPLYFNTSDLAQKFIDTQNSEFHIPETEYFHPKTGAKVLLNSTKMPTDKPLFSPRIGFNWDVKGDKTLQIRGGTGVFTGRLPFVWLGNQISGVDAWFYQTVDPNFQFPQTFRSSLGADIKLNNGVILTTDLSYTKDINGVHVQNWALNKPTGTLNGVDNRAVYGASDVVTFFGTERGSAYVMTNSSKGYAFNSSFKLAKNFDNGLFTSLAYNFLESKDVNSIEAEITGDAFNFNPASGNVNDAVLSNSKYGDKHRIIGVAGKSWTYGSEGRWKTSVSTFFEYAQGGRFSYTYGGDINNDGSGVNDLMYVPTATEITQMNFAQAGQAAAYEAYIAQDDYLSGIRGQMSERYGALSPWRGKWDVKFMQDMKIEVSDGKYNTLQFTVDILNFGNLLNSDWGLVEQPNTVSPVGVDVVNGDVTYNFSGDVKKTFAYNTSLLSRWQMQFGLRYIF
ncbi:MAG: TonB-dependent receptor, partial [Flavobacteriaceae bacterium]|nr:TonB-dependent receptor [Flavobacteriaceae bacterium]